MNKTAEAKDQIKFNPLQIKRARAELKALGEEIRSLKAKRKTEFNGYVQNLQPKRFEYRHRSIALFTLFGKSYKRIEKAGSRLSHRPNEFAIAGYRNSYYDMLTYYDREDFLGR